jgi:TetR/AcrR family transcriptional repressor of nem operon
MKKSKADAALTRKRILESASAEFRRNGIHATGMAEVMAAAGLTKGGFYRHFASKDQLVSEACAEGMKSIVQAGEPPVTRGGGPQADFRATVEDYLSVMHRDDPAGGCVLASIGSELARACPEARRVASKGFTDLVDNIAEQLQAKEPEEARSQAVFALCAMIGAITVSRIVDDPDLSATILQEAKRHLVET